MEEEGISKDKLPHRSGNLNCGADWSAFFEKGLKYLRIYLTEQYYAVNFLVAKTNILEFIWQGNFDT